MGVGWLPLAKLDSSENMLSSLPFTALKSPLTALKSPLTTSTSVLRMLRLSVFFRNPACKGEDGAVGEN